MYNNPYFNQPNVDRINNQIAELERLKNQMQQPVQPITQNFQLAPGTRDSIRYANNIEEVEKDLVIGDTPFFSKDMSVVWIKNIKGEIKSYELIEIINKDDKDIQIEYLKAQIDELKKEVRNNEGNTNIDDATSKSIKDEKSSSISTVRTTKKK